MKFSMDDKNGHDWDVINPISNHQFYLNTVSVLYISMSVYLESAPNRAVSAFIWQSLLYSRLSATYDAIKIFLGCRFCGLTIINVESLYLEQSAMSI